MNPVIENIIARKSVRSFVDKRIPDEAISLLGEAAVNAPSGMNRQEWCFVFIRNKEKIAALADAVGKALNRDGYGFYNADTLMIASALPFGSLSAADCSCALQNVFLGAKSMDIGSVWINQLNDAQKDGAVRAMLTEFGVPGDYCVYGTAALGYAAEDMPKRPRKDGRVIIVE